MVSHEPLSSSLGFLREVSHRKWPFSILAYFETLGHEITKKIPPTIRPSGPQYLSTVVTPLADNYSLCYNKQS